MLILFGVHELMSSILFHLEKHDMTKATGRFCPFPLHLSENEISKKCSDKASLFHLSGAVRAHKVGAVSYLSALHCLLSKRFIVVAA